MSLAHCGVNMGCVSATGDTCSMAQFKLLLSLSKAVIPAGSPVFESELKAAAEFMSLLPSKIDNLHFRGIEMD